MTAQRDACSRIAPADGAVRAERRRAGRDALAIGMGYLAGYAYPLVSLPLLARVLGPALLGTVMVQMAVLQLVVQISDFGFATSSLRRAALAGSAAERGRIIAQTIHGRTLVWGLCAFAVMGAVLIVPAWRGQVPVMLAGLGVVLIGAWYHGWLLQALGRAPLFALIMGGTRLIALVGLALSVHGPEDAPWAVLWQFAPQALAACLAAALLHRMGEEPWGRRISWGEAHEALRASFPLFIAGAAATVTGAANSLALGALSHPAQVAHYGAADRFGNVVRGVMRGIGDAMVPRLARGSAPTHRFVCRAVLCCYVAAGAGLILLAGPVVPFYLGEGMRPVIAPTRILGVAIIFAGISAVCTLRATAAGRYRTIARLTTISALVLILTAIIGARSAGAVGAAVALLISEAIQAALFLLDACAQRRRAPVPAETP